MRFRGIPGAIVLGVALIGPMQPAHAQEPVEEVGGGLLTAALGGAAGVIGGGYITVSLIVLQSRRGHYLHDIHDVLDWKSLSVLVGGATGAALGMWSPERLKIGTLYGAAGSLVGLGTGLVVGPLIWDDEEGKWAAAAIGAGAGLAVGSLIGMLAHELRDGNGGSNSRAAAVRVPVVLRVPF